MKGILKSIRLFLSIPKGLFFAYNNTKKAGHEYAFPVIPKGGIV